MCFIWRWLSVKRGWRSNAVTGEGEVPDLTGLGSLQEEEVRTQTHVDGRPRERSGRRRLSRHPGERPALLTGSSPIPACRTWRGKRLSSKPPSLASSLGQPLQTKTTAKASTKRADSLWATVLKVCPEYSPQAINTTEFERDKYTHIYIALVLVTWSCLCGPMDCSPPGSSVQGILQARILEWVAMPSSRGSAPPRDRTWVSPVASRFFTVWVYINSHLFKFIDK